MKTSKFRPHLADMILSGEKMTTWRMFDDKDFQEGDEVLFLRKNDLSEFAVVRLTKVTEDNVFEDMYDHWGEHEAYTSKEVMLETFQSYYPDQGVTLQTPVKVMDFEIIKTI